MKKNISSFCMMEKKLDHWIPHPVKLTAENNQQQSSHWIEVLITWKGYRLRIPLLTMDWFSGETSTAVSNSQEQRT